MLLEQYVLCNLAFMLPCSRKLIHWLIDCLMLCSCQQVGWCHLQLQCCWNWTAMETLSVPWWISLERRFTIQVKSKTMPEHFMSAHSGNHTLPASAWTSCVQSLTSLQECLFVFSYFALDKKHYVLDMSAYVCVHMCVSLYVYTSVLVEAFSNSFPMTSSFLYAFLE